MRAFQLCLSPVSVVIALPIRRNTLYVELFRADARFESFCASSVDCRAWRFHLFALVKMC
jgi:hypothetical protein